MIKVQKFDKVELAKYIFDSLFNEDVYEIFPDLENCYDENQSAMVDIFMKFFGELCDMSKPIARPLLDERSTYIYRKVYGLFDDGLLQTKCSVGQKLDLKGTRVGQILKNSNRVIINSFITDYYSIENSGVTDKTPIEIAGFSNGIYLKLKRQGINFVEDIDSNVLLNTKYFGEKTIAKIEKGISRVRK